MALDLNPTERAEVFQRVQEATFDYLDHVQNRPVASLPSADKIRKEIKQWTFQNPASPLKALEFVVNGFKKYHLQTSHPSYFGVFNPRASLMGIAGDTLAAAINPQLASWTSAPFAVEMEDFLLHQFGSQFGLPTVEGTFTSGGMEANHTALLTALNHAFPSFSTEGVQSLPQRPLLYTSSEGHHSFLKAARLCGLGNSSVRMIPVTPDLKMNVALLEKQLKKDREAGFAPFMIVGTAGTTSAGAIDPLNSLSKVAIHQQLWFHVDAAWGGAAVLVPELKGLLAGIQEADSITFDAHKWLSIPMGAGMYLSRHQGSLSRTFHIETAYMPQETLGSPLTQPYGQSMQWSRRFIGLKVFLTLAVAGWEGYANVIRRQVAMGKLLREKLKKAGWLIVNSSELPVICFVDGHAPEMNDSLAEFFSKEVAATGKAWITTTKINQKTVFRVGIPNYQTTEKNLEALVSVLNEKREDVLWKSTV